MSLKDSIVQRLKSLSTVETAPAEEEVTVSTETAPAERSHAEIKGYIQKSVIDPVVYAAEQGKWNNYKYAGFINYGASAYLNEDFLQSKLGDLCSKKNISIARKLCFEAIDDAGENSAVCAIVFSQVYSALMSADLGEKGEKNLSKIFQKGVFANDHLGGVKTAVSTRLDKVVFDPIEQMIRSGEWNSQSSASLIKVVSENFLTNGLLGSHLGSNLGAIEGILTLVQVMAFNKVLTTLLDIKSANHTTIKVLITEYPEMFEVIQGNYPELLSDNPVIKAVCEQVFLRVIKDKEVEAEKADAKTAEDLLLTASTDSDDKDVDVSVELPGEPRAIA